MRIKTPHSLVSRIYEMYEHPSALRYILSLYLWSVICAATDTRSDTYSLTVCTVHTPLGHRPPRTETRFYRHIRESGILLHSHRTPRHHNQCTQHHKISTKQTLKPTHSLTRRTLLTGARPAHAPFRLRRSSAAIAISLAPFWVTFLATAWIEKAASQALAPAWGSFRGGCSFRP